MKSHSLLTSICLIFIIGSLVLFTGTTAGLTTTQVTLSAQGTIAYPQQSYSFIIYQQDSIYYAKNGNGNIVDSSADFSVVWNYTLNSGGSTLIMNGIYYPQSLISTNIVSNVTVIGESEDGCIIDFSRMLAGTSFGSTGYIPSGQYAYIVIRGTGLTIEDLTFQSSPTVVVGLGEFDSHTPSQNDVVENIQFRNCSSGGIYIYDGSGSTVDNIRGDNPYGLVYFWYGNESNIKVSNLYMEPTLATANGNGVDSTLAFLPYNGENASNIVVNNIVGNYTTYFDQGGTNFHMGAVLDFHSEAGGIGESNSRGNVTWNNLAVSNIYGYYSPAVDVQMNFTGLTNSVFENIHSSYAQGGKGIPNGVFILPRLSNANVTISNVVFKDIYVDHASGAGFNFLLSDFGTPSASVRTIVQGITLENLYLTDNNQQKGTISSSASVLYWGIDGLNIGNQGSGINIFTDLTIKNLVATDDQALPTQQYPAVFWNYGASGTTFINVQISSYMFSGNTNNVIYQVNNQGNVIITGY